MPVGGFLFERAPAQRAETVELGAPVIVRYTPLGMHPAANLETMERRIERAFHDAQHVVGRTLNGGNDAVAMHLAATDHFENHHVERARQQLAGFLCSHKRFRDDSRSPSPCQRDQVRSAKRVLRTRPSTFSSRAWTSAVRYYQNALYGMWTGDATAPRRQIRIELIKDLLGARSEGTGALRAP